MDNFTNFIQRNPFNVAGCENLSNCLSDGYIEEKYFKFDFDRLKRKKIKIGDASFVDISIKIRVYGYVLLLSYLPTSKLS